LNLDTIGVAGSAGRVIAPLWVTPLGEHNLWIAFLIPLCGTLFYVVILLFVKLETNHSPAVDVLPPDLGVELEPLVQQHGRGVVAYGAVK